MIEETGRVARCEGEYAWVLTERRSSCGTCSAQKGCGTGALAGVFGAKTHEVKVLNPLGAEPGEDVVIGISEQMLVRGSVAVYMVPLLAMIGGGLLAQSLAPQLELAGNDMVSVVGGLMGLALGFSWLRWRTRRWANTAEFHAVVLRRLPRSNVTPINFVPRV